MKTAKNTHLTHQNGFSHFLKIIGNKISELFKPQEVEITFKAEGKNMSYTYTKVTHKQVA